MREMKDSGIEWIGRIPKSWNVHPLYYYFGERKNRNSLGLESNLLSLSYGRVIRKDINTSNGLLPESFNTYNIIEANDIIIRPTDLQNDKRSLRTGLCSEHGIITSAYIALRAVKSLNTAFFHYLLHAYDVIKVFYNMGNGVRQGLNFAEFSHLMVYEPSIAEQHRIASYLDRKCSEIDDLVTDIEKQIETLEQYKRSVITEAVTKGLKPDVEMKDSGIEWIGMLPFKWALTRIGSLYSLRVEKVSDKDYSPLSVTMKGILPQLETAAKTNDGDNRKLVKKGDFVINSRSDRRGSCGISPYDGSVSLINTVMSPRENMNPSYYNWLFHCSLFSDEFYRCGHGIVDDLWTTNWQDMKNIILPVPPLDEQQAIADYLDSKCAEIESIIADKQKQLDTLAEYKKSLIYEYVTGKKEVPMTVAVVIDPHAVLYGFIVDKLGASIRGKTQVQKILYLLDYYIGINQNTTYHRFKHGPYDINLDSYIDELVTHGWYKKAYSNADILVKGDNHDEFVERYSTHFVQYESKINLLIDFVKSMKTSQLERIATLFAVWNDFIIEGIDMPTDDQIIDDVMTNWTENKANTKRETWQGTLDKMKINNIVPRGIGNHTIASSRRELNNE
ncbi:MAG: restriction endonuclease subunit S [Oscillospiraceae bacterium]|nr:restriction endonuclease subunit S [Oscillospiraceae bacterium]